ncbi:MAG: hypothetical protein ACRDQ5_27410 [Sciscionella sp.]
MNWVFGVAFGLLALGGALDLVFGVTSRTARRLPYLFGTAASVLFVIVGAVGLRGQRVLLELDAFLGFGHASLAVDRLSALFLILCFAVAVPVSLVCAFWAVTSPRVRARSLGATYALALGSVAVIVTADQAFCFLFAWEALTVAFYLFTGYDRQRRSVGCLPCLHVDRTRRRAGGDHGCRMTSGANSPDSAGA